VRGLKGMVDRDFGGFVNIKHVSKIFIFGWVL
jgi:hypothetical protein